MGLKASYRPKFISIIALEASTPLVLQLHASLKISQRTKFFSGLNMDFSDCIRNLQRQKGFHFIVSIQNLSEKANFLPYQVPRYSCKAMQWSVIITSGLIVLMG